MSSQPLNFGSLPAAPSGATPVAFQADTPTAPPTAVVRNISGNVPAATATTPGGVPTPPNDATKFLNGQAAFARPKDSDLSTSDITTNDASTSQHGFLPKLDGSSVHYMSGTGAWSTPAGGGGGGASGVISYYLSPATIVTPTLSTWAYHVNATKTFNANGALVMTTYSSVNPEILGQTVPAEDFDLIGCFAMNPPFVSGKLCTYGLELWDSGSGKLVTLQVNMGQGSSPILQVDHYPSYTGTPSVPFQIANPALSAIPVWLRINCSYNKYTFYASVDGQSWDQVYQESTTAYMTAAADHCGVGIFNNSTSKANLVIPHFQLNSYVGS